MQAAWFSHYYRIDLKETPERYYGQSLVKVSAFSPLQLRREVEKFGYYFRREFDYAIQFEASEMGPYSAYIFSSHEGFLWVGACCFRKCIFPDLDGMELDSLQWAWLHPYFRNRGILRSHWTALKAEHGDFFLEHPLSPAMRSFFLKYAKDSAWYQAIESGKPNWDEIKARLQSEKTTPKESIGQGVGQILQR
jgi:hypothetical protein